MKNPPTTIVIGAGVSGLSVAFSLLRLGHRVSVIDRGEVGAEASWSGGGILSPLLPWDYEEAVTALSLPSMRMFPTWVEDIERASGQTVEWWPCGMEVRNPSEAVRAIDWCSAHGLPVEQRSQADGSSLWLPTIAQVRNPRLVKCLQKAIVGLGAQVYPHCAATTFISQGRLVSSLQTSKGVLHAHRFVVATGAWAGTALPGLPGVPNVRPIRGQMLLFKLDPNELSKIVYREGIYLIPRLDGHVLVGSTIEDAGFDKSTDGPTLQRLHTEATRIFPGLAGRQPVRQWAGLRPGAPNNIPVIGRHPDYENVFINTGHYRYGVTMAPASAEILSALIHEKCPVVDPAPYTWEAANVRRWSTALL